MRITKRQAKATSLDHAIELAKRHAKERRLPSKVMADLMGVELKTYYRWLLENTLPLNRIAQFEALTGSRFISEYLSVLHGDRVVIEIPRGRKGKAADMAQVQSQTAAALALLAKWHEDGSGVDETIEALTNVLALLAYQAEAQGNSEAAARYRQAVSLQRQIYRERAEQEEQAEKARAENPQAGLAAAFEAAPPQIGIPLSDLQRLIEARDKRVAEAAAESVIAGLEAAFRRTV